MSLHLTLDGFRLLYAGIAAFMWAVSGIFSLEYMSHYQNRRRYYVFFWLTFLATVGIFLSADLMTLFLFFEIMSFTSYVWVAFDERRESLRAAETYLAVAVIGGMVMLMGLFLLYHLFGTLEITALGKLAGALLGASESAGEWRTVSGETLPVRQAVRQLYGAGLCLLTGFGAKAGCFPLHIWLPKAHPVAPAPASALLSGILTKAGVFGILILTCYLFRGESAWGTLIFVLGLITMVLGALLALFSINLKRTLACSSVSQIGFILVGIGMWSLLGAAGADNATAMAGTLLHMVNHSLFKLVLFLCAGAVFMNLHELDLNQIRGYGRKKPALAFCFLMGALGIGCIPGFSGYVSKTLLHEGIVEYLQLLRESGGAYGGSGAYGTGFWLSLIRSVPFFQAAEWLFLLTGGMTIAYMLKLYVALFVEPNSDPEKQKKFDAMSGRDMRKASRLVLMSSAALFPAAGLFPHLILDRLVKLSQRFFNGSLMEEQIAYYSFTNLKGSLISIAIGLALYFGVVRTLLMTGKEKAYADRFPGWLDLENLIYRPLLTGLLPAVGGFLCGLLDRYLVPVTVQLFLTGSTVCCRAMDQLADGLILLARSSSHRQQREPEPPITHDRLAHALGHYLDRHKRPGAPSSVPALVRTEEEVLRSTRLVDESFSFGLILFAFGLCVTIGYLLYVFAVGV